MFLMQKKGAFMLDPKALGLSAGILWGLSIFLFTIVGIYSSYGHQSLEILSDTYPMYSISWLGSIVGLIAGFVDGFIVFYLLGWLYNKFRR